MPTDAEFAVKVDKALENELSESWLELEELFNEALRRGTHGINP